MDALVIVEVVLAELIDTCKVVKSVFDESTSLEGFVDSKIAEESSVSSVAVDINVVVE